MHSRSPYALPGARHARFRLPPGLGATTRCHGTARPRRIPGAIEQFRTAPGVRRCRQLSRAPRQHNGRLCHSPWCLDQRTRQAGHRTDRLRQSTWRLCQRMRITMQARVERSSVAVAGPSAAVAASSLAVSYLSLHGPTSSARGLAMSARGLTRATGCARCWVRCAHK